MSLTQCFMRMGKALDEQDKKNIRGLRDDYLSDGIDKNEADKLAIQTFMTNKLEERNRIAAEIKAQGGRPKAPPKLRTLQQRVKSSPPKPKPQPVDTTNWKVPFGKYSGKTLDEIKALNPGWFRWMVENQEKKVRASREISQYITNNYDAIVAAEKQAAQKTQQAPVSQPKQDAFPVNPDVNVKGILGLAKVGVEKVELAGKPKWLVAGQTFHIKGTLRGLGGKWHPGLRGFLFDQEPSAFLATALADETGEALKAEYVRNVKQRQLKQKAAALRVALDAMPSIKPNSDVFSDGVSDETKALVGKGLEFGMPQDVVDEQIEDAGHIKWAWENDRSIFVLASEAGSGKTFVLGAGIREILSTAPDTPVVYVTMNQGLIAQIGKDLAAYGITDNMRFMTYSELSNKSNVDIPENALLVMDEVHNAKNLHGSSRGSAAQRLLSKSRLAVFASATPYENPVEMEYLEATGVFDSIEGEFEGFVRAYGAIKRGKKLVWPGGRGLKPHAAAARAWLDKQGMYTQRRKRLPDGLVESAFQGVDMPKELIEIFQTVTAAYDAAMQEDGSFLLGMQKMNTQKRILESAKVGPAIERAKAALERGEQVAIFTETKSERTIAPEASSVEMMQENDIATAMGEPRPWASWKVARARAFEEYNVDFSLPSLIEEVVESFGREDVAIYTGAKKFSDELTVTNKSVKDELAEWKAGDRKVFVATMAKGGTGLSLHATEEGFPRTQININLPWKATGVDQVSGRLARYGMRSPVRIEWLFGKENEIETKIARRVGDRMASMGALVSGIELSAAEHLQDWDFSGEVDVGNTSEIKFRKGKRPRKPLTPKTVRQMVDSLTSGWKGAPQITVVKELADLPIMLQDAMRKNGIEGVPGMIMPNGEVILMSDYLQSARQVQETVFHEVVGHYGVEVLLSPLQVASLFASVNKSTDPKILAAAKYVDEVYENATPYVRGAEIIARIAEQNPQHSLIDKIVVMFRNALRKLGFNLQLKHSDVVNVLLAARARVRDSKAPESVNIGQPQYQMGMPTLNRDEMGLSSALLQAAQKMKQQKMPASQALKVLLKSPGVKQEEVQWTGLEDYLSTFPHKSITKDELVTFINNNGVVLEETILDQPEGKYATGVTWERLLPTGDKDSVQVKDAQAMLDIWNRENGYASAKEGYTLVSVRSNDSNPILIVVAFGPDNRTEYLIYEQGNYDAKGPNPSASVDRSSIWSIGEAEIQAREVMFERGYKDRSDNSRQARWDEYIADESWGDPEAYREYLIQIPGDMEYTNDVHFHEPNIVAFLRVTEREIDGLRTFFIEELQSDWHQAGREFGYLTDDIEQEYEELGEVNRKRKKALKLAKSDALAALGDSSKGPMRELRHVWQEAETFGAGLMSPDTVLRRIEYVIESSQRRGGTVDQYEKPINDPGIGKAYTTTLEYASKYPELRRFMELHYDYVRDRGKRSKIRDMPPDAPFKRDAWIALGLKRAIAAAVDQGFEQVAWSDSAILAERWGDNALSMYEMQYDKKMPSIAKKLLGTEAYMSRAADESGHYLGGGAWVVPITTEARKQVEEVGFPMFRRQASRLANTEAPRPYLSKDWWIRMVQDKMLPLKRVQEELDRLHNRWNAMDAEDPYGAETRMYGKAARDIDEFKKRYVEKLTKMLGNSNISLEELDKYLIAKHAEERNNLIESRDPNNTAGSGMSTGEARALLASYTGQRKAQMEEAAGVIYDMLDLNRRVMGRGLTPTDMISDYEEMFEFYVPLRGFKEGSDAAYDSPGLGQGLDIRGRESRHATGRSTEALSPTATTISMVANSFVRLRKNEVGNAFLNMVEANPDPDMWEVFTEQNPDKKTFFSVAQNRNVSVKMRPYEMQDEYFATKRGGQTYYIKIHDKLLLRAMKNLGPQPLGPFLKVMNRWTRFLSSLNTSYNPPFIAVNFLRDLQTATINLMAEETKSDGRIEGEKLAMKITANAAPAVRGIFLAINNKPGAKDNEWSHWYERFRAAGGKTDFWDSKDILEQIEELNKQISRAQQGKPIKGTGKRALEFIESVNTAVENGVRLAAFRAAVEVGKTPEQAALLAKDLTVNFNRKGELGHAINSLYMFANASVQGTATLARALSPKNKRGEWELNAAHKAALLLTASSFVLSFVNRMFSDDDDDGVSFYDKIERHEKERNIIIMDSIWGGDPQEYTKIPLPYGYNLFHVIGTAMEHVAFGDMKSTSGVGMVMSAFIGSFVPIGIQYSEDMLNQGLKSITPSALGWLSQLVVNEDGFGRPIYRENRDFDTPKPDSELGRYNTGEQYKWMARGLHSLTGGTEHLPDGVDINPDSIAHMLEYVLGGMGSTVKRSMDVVEATATGKELPNYKLPLIRRFRGENVDRHGDIDLFYDRWERSKQWTEELKSSDDKAYKMKNKGFIPMKQMGDDIAQRLSKQRKALDIVRNAKSMSQDDRNAKSKKIEDAMDALADQYNKRWSELIDE